MGAGGSSTSLVTKEMLVRTNILFCLLGGERFENMVIARTV